LQQTVRTLFGTVVPLPTPVVAVQVPPGVAFTITWAPAVAGVHVSLGKAEALPTAVVQRASLYHWRLVLQTPPVTLHMHPEHVRGSVTFLAMTVRWGAVDGHATSPGAMKHARKPVGGWHSDAQTVDGDGVHRMPCPLEAFGKDAFVGVQLTLPEPEPASLTAVVTE